MPEAWPLFLYTTEKKRERERIARMKRGGGGWLMQILGCVCCERTCLDSLAAGLMTSDLWSSGCGTGTALICMNTTFTLSLYTNTIAFSVPHDRKLRKYTCFYLLYPRHQTRLIIFPLFRNKEFCLGTMFIHVHMLSVTPECTQEWEMS